MKEIKTRLSPDNANKNNKNYIFGNLENSIDYHHIKDYDVGDKVLLTHERINDADVVEIFELYVEPEIEVRESDGL